jgi:hypothetical protein
MTSEDVLLEHFSLSAFELGEFMGREGRYLHFDLVSISEVSSAEIVKTMLFSYHYRKHHAIIFNRLILY